jgi:hypothetical protein
MIGRSFTEAGNTSEQIAGCLGRQIDPLTTRTHDKRAIREHSCRVAQADVGGQFRAWGEQRLRCPSLMRLRRELKDTLS